MTEENGWDSDTYAAEYSPVVRFPLFAEERAHFASLNPGDGPFLLVVTFDQLKALGLTWGADDLFRLEVPTSAQGDQSIMQLYLNDKLVAKAKRSTVLAYEWERVT